MKKFIFLLIAVFLFNAAKTQVVINSLSMPTQNEKIKNRTTNSVNGANYTATGANYTWNFTGLTSTTQVIDTFLSPLATSFAEYYKFIDATDTARYSNLAIRTAMMSLPGLTITDAFTYFKNSYSKFLDLGIGLHLNTVPVTLKFDISDQIYKFPITYGTTDSSKSQASQTIFGFGYFGERRHRVNMIDGWGVLHLPNDTFNVIRVKSTVTITDTLYITATSTPYSFTRNIIEYKWLNPTIHLPVLQIDEMNSTLSVKYYSHLPFGINEAKKNNTDQIKLYPNPATDKLTITLSDNSSDYTISVIDMVGNEVLHTYYDGSKENSIDVSHLQKGIYFIAFQNAEKRITRKFIKQ